MCDMLSHSGNSEEITGAADLDEQSTISFVLVNGKHFDSDLRRNIAGEHCVVLIAPARAQVLLLPVQL